MATARFGAMGLVLSGLWVAVALLVTADPGRFFWMLSFGRVALPTSLIRPFRVLGILNAIGSLYLLAHLAFGSG